MAKHKRPFDPNEAPYDVGYGKPPEKTRFKPGQSGNPSGRPKGRRTDADSPGIFDIIRKEGTRKMVISDPSGQKTITMREAAIRATYLAAVKGSANAQKLVMKLEEDTANYLAQRRNEDMAAMSNEEFHKYFLETALDVFDDLHQSEQERFLEQLKSRNNRKRRAV